MNITATELRNLKSSLFSERDTVDKVCQYAESCMPEDKAAAYTIVGLTVNTVLENLAKEAEKDDVILEYKVPAVPGDEITAPLRIVIRDMGEDKVQRYVVHYQNINDGGYFDGKYCGHLWQATREFSARVESNC